MYSLFPRTCMLLLVLLVIGWFAGLVWGQETDITQTPNSVNAGIKKSLEDQIGQGRGDINIPDSSLYLIQRDPFRSIARGRQLFHENLLLLRDLARVLMMGSVILRLRDL